MFLANLWWPAGQVNETAGNLSCRGCATIPSTEIRRTTWHCSYYHYCPEFLSPPRAVQLDDMQQPHCAWCGMWGWAFAEIRAFSIAIAELPRLFQLVQCWFDNPTLLKYLLPMHSESHNRSHMNWDVWKVWNPMFMMIRWLLTLWWSTGKCACSISRSITKQTQSKILEQLTSLSPNQNVERKKDSLSYPPKNQHLTYNWIKKKKQMGGSSTSK